MVIWISPYNCSFNYLNSIELLLLHLHLKCKTNLVHLLTYCIIQLRCHWRLLRGLNFSFTCFGHLGEVREPLLDRKTYTGHGDEIRQTQVPHHGSSHQACSLILTWNCRCDEHGHAVWPGDAVKLVPPARDNDGDIETQDESQWNQVVVRLTVVRYFLKYPEGVKIV